MTTFTKFKRSRFKGCKPRCRRTRPTANTVLVVDCSGSMCGQITGLNGRTISKRDAAVEATLLLIEHKKANCPQDLIGLVGFGSYSFVALPLTKPNHPKIRSRVQGLRICGLTNMGAGIRQGLKLLSGRSGRFLRNMVLLSDGHPTCGTDLDALARKARSERVNLHTIGVGNAADFDEQLLRRLSSLTHNGKYQHVRSLQELVQSIRSVG